MELPFENFEVFLAWIISGAGGVAIAHVLENMDWFKSMASGNKFWFVLVLSVILPVVGILLRVYMYGDLVTVDTFFVAVQSAIVFFASSQYTYSRQIKANKVV